METTTKVCTKCKVEKPFGDFHRDNSKKTGRRNRCKECVKKYQQENTDKIRGYDKKYYQENANRIKERRKQYRQENADKVRETKKQYQNERRNSDPLYKMIHNLRRRVYSYCRAIKVNKSTRTKQMIGVDLTIFKSYMESKFQEGMTWENYGQWHIDHIKPLSLATTEQEVVELNHYTNLQPLWAVDNIKKSNKYEKSH
jgi:hypothetical protein